MIDFDVLCRADRQELWRKAPRKANTWHLDVMWFYIKDVEIKLGSNILFLLLGKAYKKLLWEMVVKKHNADEMEILFST